MFEALKYYQNLAERFQSQILTVPGIIIVIVGLCIWLAGLRWRRILGAMVGGAIFAAIVSGFSNYGFQAVLVAIFIGIVFGTVAENFIIGILGAVAAAIVVLAILSVSMPRQQGSEYLYPKMPEYEQNNRVIPAADAIRLTKEMAWYFVHETTEIIKSASIVAFAAAGVTLLAVGFAAWLMPRIFFAVVSSLLGSAVIFAGMILLLFYKGSKPVNFIAEKGRFYIMVLAVMTVFGVIVQLALSPSPVKQVKKEDVPKNEKKWR